MSSHRSPLSRRRGTGRTRALMSLGAVGFLALGFGAQGTFAFWTDQASVNPGTFSSGTLDITLNGALAGNGGSTTIPGFGIGNLAPGDTRAVTIPVRSAGTVGLTYTISGSGTGTLAPRMQFSVFPGAATNTTTCSGTAIVSNQVLTATNTLVVGGANARTLGPTTAEDICVLARLDPNTPNSLQGQSMNASLVFDAAQIGQ